MTGAGFADPATAGAVAGWPLGMPGPMEALADLLAGNRRFAAGRARHGYYVTSPHARSATQRPYALVVGCLDSRVIPEAVLDQDFGSLVVVRTGGHVLDFAGLGSVDFAVATLGVPLIMVLGHQYCGAIATATRAVTTGVRPDGPLGLLVDQIEPAIREAADEDRVSGTDPSLGMDDGTGMVTAAELAAAGRAERIEICHVGRTVDRLSALPVANDRIAAGELAVVGARYEVDTGRVVLVRP